MPLLPVSAVKLHAELNRAPGTMVDGVIVSASYRTDIPAFYAEWFFERLRHGSVRVKNPYSAQYHEVSLRREDVDGFVFWTRNFGPVLPRLSTLLEFGRPFTVQYTVTGYPRMLEAAVVPAETAIAQIRALSRDVHALCPVWRYDPIVLSEATPYSFHREQFRALAQRLEGATDEVVTSFVHIYAKSARNLAKSGLTVIDPVAEEKRELAAELAGIARQHGMSLTLCSQPEHLAEGCGEARCVDAARLAAIAGYPVHAALKGNRPGCACHESRDIGDYDTCPHGCSYCYAVRSRATALRRYKAHSPLTESL